MDRQTALIIGAGPAGLTAALEFTRRSDIIPIVLERDDHLGGISRTVQYKGNRIDIGGHRFFSKSDRVMNWWTDILPVEGSSNGTHDICYRRQTRAVDAPTCGPDPTCEDRVMLIRNRKSRIFFLRQFFDYPISLNSDTVRKLGWRRMTRIGLSYARASMRPRRPEATLEDFLINRFGEELYRTFFKSYTEKVWGVPCKEISAEWGAQRIKGLSVRSAIAHLVKKRLGSAQTDIGQKTTETSLIEKFMYPKLGPGQLWECVASEVRKAGGCVQTGWRVDKIHSNRFSLTGVTATHTATGQQRTIEADYVLSTMPVRELIQSLDCEVPENVTEVSRGLQYRDFITVGMLLRRMKIHEHSGTGSGRLTDNWVYIQEPDVTVGRMQIFNNWSPWLVDDPDKIWIGLEYFCNDSDALWKMCDEDIIDLGRTELHKMGVIDPDDVLDACVIRVPKAYPAYFGSYTRFGELRSFVDQFANLFLIGRNGMHKYNNQDHSMLTAMTAVENILEGRSDKDNIWALNTEMEYHESSGKG